MAGQLSPIQIATPLVFAAQDQFISVFGDDEKGRAVFAREASFAIQALSKSDFSLKVARENSQSVIDAVANVAAIGISLNPVKKQAYLIPRKDRGKLMICLDIGYQGLVDLATQSGAIRWVQAMVVREGDVFRRNGIDKAPTHEFDEFEEGRSAKPIRGVYCTAKTADGDFITHTMDIGKVLSIRDRSDAWKSYKRGDITSCPWSTDEEEMVKKTCLKQGSKSWPRDKTDDRLDRAISYMNTTGGEGVCDLVDNDTDSQAADAGIKMPVRKTAAPAAPAADPNPTDAAKPATNASSEPATEGERAHIKMKAGDKLVALLAKFGLADIADMTKAQFAPMRAAIKEL